MAAAPFKGILKFVAQDGKTFAYPVTVSDVNAAFYIFPDGNNVVSLPTGHGTLALVDVALSASGTDTSTGAIYVNGKNTGELVMNALCVATNLSREFMGSPLYIAEGSLLRITQQT